MTTIFLFLAASISIFPKPTAKLEIILILFESFEIIFASNTSVIEDNIPSQSLLLLINASFPNNLSSLFNSTLKIFKAYSSVDLISFLVIKIFFINILKFLVLGRQYTNQ